MSRKKQITTLWAFDTEDDSKGNPYLINFYNGEIHHTFKTSKEATRFLLNLTGKNEFWATNLQYDLVNTFSEEMFLLEIGYIGSRVISAKIKDTQIKFMDTLNHWKISVEEMGKRINLHKLNPNGNYNNVEYCQRDTEITYNFVKTMKTHYESIGAELKPTIGSTALKLFETHFYKRQSDRIFTKKEIEFMLEGYYGGRTEIFFNKPVEGNIQYYDFNSLYPSCMLNPVPNLKDHFFTKKPNFKQEGMCDITIRSPDNLNIPYLPFRSDTSLLFPLGVLRGVYTYFEIRESLKLGYSIKKIHKAIEFPSGTTYPFLNYVETLYKKRLQAQKEKDELLSDAFKLLLNNLYGKYGQGNEFTELIPIEKDQNILPGDVVFGSMLLRTKKGEYPVHTNVIWSAYITAYARDKLHKAMMKVEENKGLLIYCDTDSVIFESNKKIFKDSKELGGLKPEGKFRYAHFKLPKLYKLIDTDNTKKYRSKGVPRKFAEDFFETGKAVFQRPYKLREVLRRNLSPKRTFKLVANFWDSVEKETTKIYDKRMVEKSGATRPLIVDPKGERWKRKKKNTKKAFAERSKSI